MLAFTTGVAEHIGQAFIARRNVFDHAGPLRVNGGVRNVVLEGNQFTDQKQGIAIGSRKDLGAAPLSPANVLVRDNTMVNVKEPFGGLDKSILSLDNTIVKP